MCLDMVKAEKDMTTLLCAAKISHAGQIRVLLEAGADVNGINIHGNTALMIAAGLGHLDKVKVLVKHGADTSLTCNHGTALDVALQQGQDHVVEFLRESQKST